MIMTTSIAYIGCGYVADLYNASLGNGAGEITVRGVYDKNTERCEAFAKHYGLNTYPDLQSVLDDPEVDIVVNLTNPKHHYAISMEALKAGKHVYSEKPLALKLEQAQELVRFSEVQGLHIVCAPSSVLGEAAQTLMRAVRNKTMGEPRLVYAEVDDGLIHRIGMEGWKSPTDVPWPCTDELETGCTLEHSGYVLSWLVAMFGPARRVVSYAKLCITDRGEHTPQNYTTPDFSCACVEFDSGIVARISNSIVAPHDHRFRVFCDDGHIELEEAWDFESPVYAVPVPDTRLKRQLEKRLGWTGRKLIKPARTRNISSAKQGYHLDFMIGVQDMAAAIKSGTSPRLGGEFSLHITEVSLAIQHPDLYGTDYRVQSSAPAVAPMDWAS